MPLRVGDTAVPFTLPSKPGHPVDVGGSIGKDTIVLLFFPFAYSSVCTAEMCGFRDQWKQWEGLHAKVFGISIDSPFVTDKFRVDEKIPFPILSDFNKDVSRQYGVLHEDLMGLKGVSKRSAFVIGGDGKVKYAWVTEDPKVQVKFDEIKAALAS
jgi:glutaredoxin-dependent peroxiredoxin